jgi:hypothetical protein
LKLLDDIKSRVDDERTAMAILQEVNKDVRMAQIREERGFVVEESATEKQKNFLKKLGVDLPNKLTKREASILIDEEIGKESS